MPMYQFWKCVFICVISISAVRVQSWSIILIEKSVWNISDWTCLNEKDGQLSEPAIFDIELFH